ncbi:MAG: molecular chaperone DnaK [Acidobacteria bacterium]|nr:MAG: molecular chaperone DnaK [Acidobacteriota bacterium]
MSKIIGIDLGTTNCCVSVSEGSRPSVIPNREGSRTTPSVVGFTEAGEKLIGHIARRQSITNPQNTVYAVKRLIGQKFDSEQSRSAREHLPYEIVRADNGDAWVKVRDQEFSPQEISAMFLKHLKEAAEHYLGSSVSEAIITVPAYFDDSQRQATRDAGTIAGLDVQRIINEPTAAALAYGLEKEFDGKVAVFDLGGGTFDISILVIEEGVFEVQSTAGDTFLGGEDFDRAILEWMVDAFQKDTGINLKFDKMALQRLKEAAEKAKCELSSINETEITLPFISADATGAKHLNLHLTRDKFNELIQPLVDRTEKPCREALESAGLKAEELDRVILVGGQTRTPLILEKVEDFFGIKPTVDLNPDEVVGIGAAIQGAILKGEVKDIVLLDVTPLSLGIETQGGLMYRMIEKNANIPTSFTQVFTTVADNQTVVSIHVLQGESELVESNKSLARFDLVDIPPAPKGVPQIDVTFSIDSNGIVNVSAVDKLSNKKQSIEIIPSSGLSPGEIDSIINKASARAEEDAIRKELILKKNKLEGLIYTVERTFSEYQSNLSSEEVDNVKETIAEAKRACSTEDADLILPALEELTKTSKVLSEFIMFNPTRDDT